MAPDTAPRPGADAQDDSVDTNVTGRDRADESTPDSGGHSTADSQARRNQEDESPS